MKELIVDPRTANENFEKALIRMREATDGRGRKVLLGPAMLGPDPPRPRRFAMYLKGMMSPVEDNSVFLTGSGPVTPNDVDCVRSEESFATNIALLAEAWRAAVIYWAIKDKIL